MDILSNFAERMKELIFERQISPERIAFDLNHNVFDFYHWSSPSNKYMPTVANIIKIADYFGCSIDFLVGLSDDSKTLKSVQPLPSFSKRFPFIVKEQGFNLYKLGKTTNTSTTTYYRWINETAVPTIDSLIKVSLALDCSVDYLLGREN